MNKIIFSIVTAAAAISVSALPRVVCFRFDDNQNVKKYTVLADVFRNNGVRFSMSLIPFAAPSKNPAWQKMVRELSDEGFEIMDHTPQHSTLYITFEKNDPLLKKAQNAPFVHHINNGKVCFKYDMKGTDWSAPIPVEITKGNRISDHPAFKTRRLLEIGGKYYYLVPGKLKLLSIWAEDNVRLPDAANVPARWCRSRLTPYPGAAEFMVECSREGFRRIGLKNLPQTWIQPGGYYPLLEPRSLSKVLKKYGYIAATTNPGVVKGFGDPDMELNRFALDWGDFSMERQTLAQVKTLIADAVACHRTPIASSHIRIKGTLEDYAHKHDQLLKWLKENDIQVITQKQLASLLLHTPIDPRANAFPALDRDLDQNGRPDGISAGKNVIFSARSASLTGTGRLLEVKRLCGLPKGKVCFRFQADRAFTGLLQFRFYRADKKQLGTHAVKIAAVPGKNSSCFTIPDQCAFLDFEWNKTSPEQAAVSALELAGCN